jgi:methionyl-tRNA formyltransferase
LKIVFAGTPANAAQTLRALANSAFEVVAVLTRTDAPVGRKKILTQSPVADAADELGLPVIKANRVDETTRLQLKATGADLGIIVAYGALLDQAALDILEKGWINLHYSLLPKWRGAAPVQRAIMAGDRETGVTLFQLDKGMDTGPIHLQIPTVIEPDESTAELLPRLTNLGISGLAELLPRVASNLSAPVAQDSELLLSLPTADKLTRDDARIDWHRTAVELENQIRGLNPEPMAWTTLDEDAFRIIEARALGVTDWQALAGEETLVGSVRIDKERVLVTCGQGTLLELKTVQPAGKKPMSSSDWARGMTAGKKVIYV